MRDDEKAAERKERREGSCRLNAGVSGAPGNRKRSQQQPPTPLPPALLRIHTNISTTWRIARRRCDRASKIEEEILSVNIPHDDIAIGHIGTKAHVRDPLVAAPKAWAPFPTFALSFHNHSLYCHAFQSLYFPSSSLLLFSCEIIQYHGLSSPAAVLCIGSEHLE